MSKLLVEQGATLIDADDVSHHVLKKGQWGYARFLAAFSREIRIRPELLDRETGEVNRPLLRLLVFGSPELRRRINAVTHVPIAAELLRRIVVERFLRWRPMVVLDAPLMFETGLQHVCKWVITVACTEETQERRLVQRDSIDATAARQMMRAQLPLRRKIKLSDYIVHNDRGLEELRHEVQACVRACPS